MSPKIVITLLPYYPITLFLLEVVHTIYLSGATSSQLAALRFRTAGTS